MVDEVEPDLPGGITSITVQKHNRKRYSVFVNGSFLMGVAESTLLKFDLSKGVEVTPLLYRKLQHEEGHHTVKSYFLKLLGNRAHTRKELRIKAAQKDYPEDISERVLEELQEQNYIDEYAFAEKFAADKCRSNWGPVKIRAHLSKKGVDRKIAERCIEKVFTDQDLRETFLHLVLKHKRRFLREEDSYKRRKKIFDHLRRKGYQPSNIHKYLDELTETVAS